MYFFFLVQAAQPNNEADLKGPVFTKEPENRIDFSNSTGAVVECRANGSPPPEIIWVRSDGTAVGDVPGLRQVSEHNPPALEVSFMLFSYILGLAKW